VRVTGTGDGWTPRSQAGADAWQQVGRHARCVPGRTVNHGDSRSLTDNENTPGPALPHFSSPVPDAFQAGHAGSIPVIHSHPLALSRWSDRLFDIMSDLACWVGCFVPRTCPEGRPALRLPSPGDSWSRIGSSEKLARYGVAVGDDFWWVGASTSGRSANYTRRCQAR
jgi:hypothetical protein